MKQCSKCKEVKGFECFGKDKSRKDGYRLDCKECRKRYTIENQEKIRQQRVRHYEKNGEKIREKNKLFHKNNPDYRKRTYRENQEIELENARLYREQNPEKVRESHKRFMESEKGSEINYRKKMKRRSHKMKVDFSPHQRKTILERDNYTCQHCGITVHDRRTGDWNTHDKGHIDHVIPISKGGDSTPDNLQTLCRTCNLSKSDKIVI